MTARSHRRQACRPEVETVEARVLLSGKAPSTPIRLVYHEVTLVGSSTFSNSSSIPGVGGRVQDVSLNVAAKTSGFGPLKFQGTYVDATLTVASPAFATDQITNGSGTLTRRGGPTFDVQFSGSGFQSFATSRTRALVVGTGISDNGLARPINFAGTEVTNQRTGRTVFTLNIAVDRL